MSLRVNIVQDNDPISPREFDNLGTILYSSTRYQLGDKCVSRQEIQEIVEDPNNITLPVYAYIHSGIVLNTSGFSCPWDSGQSGIIYVSKQKIREEFKVKKLSAKLKAKVLEILKSEVEIYSHYLSGEVYGYQLLDENDDVVDSCYGFYSYNEAEEASNDALNYYNKESVNSLQTISQRKQYEVQSLG